MKTLKGLFVALVLVMSNVALADTSKTTKSSAELDVTIEAQLNGKVIVGFQKLEDEIVKIAIYNTYGELVHSEKVKDSKTIVKRFDLSELPAGDYSYVVSNEVYSVSKTITKN